MARSLWSAALRPRLAKSERLSVELDAADDSYRQYSTTGAGAGMGHGPALLPMEPNGRCGGRFEPLARARGRSIVSTDREWLHGVASCRSSSVIGYGLC